MLKKCKYLKKKHQFLWKFSDVNFEFYAGKFGIFKILHISIIPQKTTVKNFYKTSLARVNLSSPHHSLIQIKSDNHKKSCRLLNPLQDTIPKNNPFPCTEYTKTSQAFQYSEKHGKRLERTSFVSSLKNKAIKRLNAN